MRTHEGYDAQDSYEHVRDSMGENVRNGNDDIESNGRRFQDTPLDIVATMRIFISPGRAASVDCCYVAYFDRLSKKYRLWVGYSETRRE